MTAADDISEFYVHTARVRTRGEDTAWGTERADPVEVECFIDWGETLVRDGAGNEITAQAVLTAAPEHAPRFTPGSTVEAQGRVTHVITAAPAESHGLDLPDHVEVTLT